MELLPFNPCEIVRISAGVRRDGNEAEFTYQLNGATGEIVIPGKSETSARAEHLWRATCFKAFLVLGKSTYAELSFSPSGEWAAYQFPDYRQQMRELEIGAPEIRFDSNRLIARVSLPSNATAGAPLGLAANLEHRSGVRSYWALAHPRSNRPDLHARDCFAARLP